MRQEIWQKEIKSGLLSRGELLKYFWS